MVKTSQLYLSQGIVFYLGCLMCYTLQVEAGLTPVISAALTGLFGSFIHFPRFYERKGLQALIYAGAFAGMCSREILSNHTDVITLSSIGAAIYLLSRPFGNGFGGRLGTIAFVASLLFFFLRQVSWP